MSNSTPHDNPHTIVRDWIGFVGVWGGGWKCCVGGWVGGLKFSEKNLSAPHPPTKNVTYIPTKTLICFKDIYLRERNVGIIPFDEFENNNLR